MMEKIFIMILLLFVSCSKDQVIADVNGKKITLNHLKQELAKLPEDMRNNYERDLPGLLEQLIIKELLVTEAARLKLDTVGSVNAQIKNDWNKRDEILINQLFTSAVFDELTVTEDEIAIFYEENQSQMNNLTLDQMRPQIQEYLFQQKRQAAVETYITDLLKAAKINRNEKWLLAEEKKVSNPLTSALKNGNPTMVDFGSTTCLPCIQMKPIIEELQNELSDKANIIFINVNEQPALTRQYKIMLIPLQVFFDKSGNEIYRHIGFYPKDSLMIWLKKAGLE